MSSFLAMGTEWWIACDRPDLLADAEAWVRAAEHLLSRFIPDSLLCRLNAERIAEHPLLAAVVSRALVAQGQTDQVFDLGLGDELCALGYDRDFGAGLPVAAVRTLPRSQLGVHVDGTVVRLTGAGTMDLGGIAKAWTVDFVHDRLRANGATRVLVDGGGDLRASGQEWDLAGPDGHPFRIGDGAVATSSCLKRKWKDATGKTLHHLVDPATGQPAESTLVAATVRAKTAVDAEVFAKAVVIRPALLERVTALGMSALVQDRNLQWWVTGNWEAS